MYKHRSALHYLKKPSSSLIFSCNILAWQGFISGLDWKLQNFKPRLGQKSKFWLGIVKKPSRVAGKVKNSKPWLGKFKNPSQNYYLARKKSTG
jgi:hypothetical protein